MVSGYCTLGIESQDDEGDEHKDKEDSEASVEDMFIDLAGRQFGDNSGIDKIRRGEDAFYKL
jgi:hypothetical protein